MSRVVRKESETAEFHLEPDRNEYLDIAENHMVTYLKEKRSMK